MKNQTQETANPFPGLEFIVVPNESYSPQAVIDESKKAMNDYNRVWQVLSGNYKGLTYDEISDTVRFIERDLTDKKNPLNLYHFAERDPTFKANLGYSLERAYDYLDANKPKRNWGKIGRAAAAVLLALIYSLGQSKEVYSAPGLPAEKKPVPGGDSDTVKPSPSIGVRLPRRSYRKKVDSSEDQSTTLHAENSRGESSGSALLKADYKSEKFKAEIVHAASYAEADRSSPTATGYESEDYEEKRNLTTLKLDFNAGAGLNPANGFNIAIRGLYQFDDVDYENITRTQLGGPVWTRTEVDVDQILERWMGGICVEYHKELKTCDKDGNPEWVEAGGIYKYDGSKVDLKTTIDTDGSVTRDPASESQDTASLGLTFSWYYKSNFGRLNALWNKGMSDNFSDYSDDNFELNAYTLHNFNPSFLAGLDYSNQGGRSSGDICLYWNTTALPAGTAKRAAESLDEKLDDKTFFNLNSFTRENERFMNSLIRSSGLMSNSWALEIGAGEEDGGYWNARFGQDIETRTNQNLTWAIVTKQGELEKNLGVMLYYSWKKSDANFVGSLGVNFNDASRSEMIDDSIRDKQWGVGGRIEGKF